MKKLESLFNDNQVQKLDTFSDLIMISGGKCQNSYDKGSTVCSDSYDKETGKTTSSGMDTSNKECSIKDYNGNDELFLEYDIIPENFLYVLESFLHEDFSVVAVDSTFA